MTRSSQSQQSSQGDGLKQIVISMTSPLLQTLIQLELNGTSREFIDEVRDYVLNLAKKELPLIFTTEHFALSAGVSPALIQSIIENHSRFYSAYAIRKKSGGNRWILAPREELKYFQTWIKLNILDKTWIHEKANGFVKSKSIKTNADVHVDQKIILNIDLYRFFDSITVKRVYGVFVSLGYAKNLSYDLAMLMCATAPDKYWAEIANEGIIKQTGEYLDKIILPQGSPASPILTNILCSRLDKRLQGLALKLKSNYSRYVDDITFSGNDETIPSLNTVKKIITEEGFYVNQNKIKYTRHNLRQMVTGLVVNKQTKVLRKLKRNINTHLYFCQKFGVKGHLDHMETKGIKIKSNFKHWLLGHISFINSVEPEYAKGLFEKFSSISWEF